MEKLRECLICGTTDSLRKQALKLRDYSLTNEEFSISRCDSCEALLTDPRPSPEEIGKYYEFPEYVSHRDDAPGLINRLYQIARRWTTERKVALITDVVRGNTESRSLLDYGCGTGYFLQAAQAAGWQVQGIELNEPARITASQRIKREVVATIDALPANNKYKVITLWHVLEHIHALNETVEKLFARLAPRGVLVVAVPNTLSLDARKYGKWWAAYDVPRHLYHFTPQSIDRLVERQGARVVRRTGQPLDSFYISLLSEKYKQGSMLKGWWQGLQSYISAWKTGNYSSIIYVIERLETSK